MKRILLTTGLLIFALAAHAGFRGYQNTTDLGLFQTVKCSTGLTCSKVGDKLQVVSSPSLVGPLTLEKGAIFSNSSSYDVSVASSGDTSFSVKGGEALTAILKLVADEGDDTADTFSLTATASNTLLLKNGSTTIQTFNASGDITGSGANSIAGYLQKRVAATATTITAAQCGSTFYNSGAVQMELPEASTVLGCRLTFITANASNFDVNPDNADQILVLTNAAGDAIRNATLGNSITLEAVSASEWAQVAGQGTYTDIN